MIQMKTIKDILINQIKEQYQGILDRQKNGWEAPELNNYRAGTENTLMDMWR